MKNLRIVFMGTPEFAVATLGSLLMNGYNVVSVVTAPDKPAGRGRKITRSAVSEFADMSALPLLQPSNLKDPSFIKELEKLEADLFIVVAFRMLPEAVWKIPPIGTINLHASLLPQYRGAAPINHVIINGEKTTGVTTFFINESIDTGNILMREEIVILPNENAGDLHNRLMKTGARLMIKTIRKLSSGSLVPVPQPQLIKPGEKLRTAPKISPELCIINWDRNCTDVSNLIRGLSPTPCARTFISDNKSVSVLKIYECQPENEPHSKQPGEIITDGKSFLKISCRKGFLRILSLQAEGRKRMNTADFLRGTRMDEFTIRLTQQA